MERLTRSQAIRAKCIDCCCGQIYEVSKCTAINCPLWNYRMGHETGENAPKRPRKNSASTEK